MSKLLQDAVAEFAKLPGVGRRTALRLSMHLLKMDAEAVEQMTSAIARFRREVRHCEECNNLSDEARYAKTPSATARRFALWSRWAT